MTTQDWAVMETPIGKLLIAGGSDGVSEIRFESQLSEDELRSKRQARSRPIAEAVEQLSEYFQGECRTFDLTLCPSGTEFQRRVWAALREIPYGETVSYGEIARRIGAPNAARAVGAANGRNPIPIVVPCHRVIGSDGNLTGFGGGLSIKRELLELEWGWVVEGGGLNKNGPDVPMSGAPLAHRSRNA